MEAPDLRTTDKYTPGIAPIKAEYILHKSTSATTSTHPAATSEAIPVKIVDDDAAERSTNPATNTTSDTAAASSSGETPKKLKGAARKRARREEAAAAWAAQRAEKKSKSSEKNGKQGGQNKGRQFNSLKDGKGLCHGFLSKGVEGCKFGKDGGKGCRFSHDLVEYLSGKDRDLFLPPVPHKELDAMTREQKQQWLEERYSLTLLPATSPATSANAEGETEEGDKMETFVRASSSSVAPPSDAATVKKSDDPAHQSLDWTTSCPIFTIKGFCTMGWKCRFLGSHVRTIGPSSLTAPEAPTGFANSGLELVIDAEKLKAWRERPRAFTKKGDEDKDQEESTLVPVQV